jgi:hypothetical protein
MYTERQLARRIEAIYRQAITAYEQIVTRWFPSFRHRLQRAVTLPARLHLVLGPSEFRARRAQPKLSEWWEPLPTGSKSHVEVSISGDESTKFTLPSREILEENLSRLVELRPDARSWIGINFKVGLVFEELDVDAIRATAFEWLSDDLKRNSWLN